MRKKHVVMLGMAWGASLLLAFGLGAGVTRLASPRGTPRAERTHAPKMQAAAPPAQEKAGAIAEEMVSGKPEDSGADENDRLRVAFRQALKHVVDSQPRNPSVPPAPPHIQSLWDRAYARWKARKDAGMFGGLDESMNLMADMSRTGAPGMNFLANLVGNGQRPMEERELALAVLSHVQDGAALGAILKLDAPDVTELDYPYDLIETQVASLSTPEVRPYISEIVAQANADLGARDSAPERAEVLAILAYVHGDRGAEGLLRDPRILGEDLTGAVQTAADIHTPAARQYVQWVADNHPGGNVQQAAGAALQEW